MRQAFETVAATTSQWQGEQQRHREGWSIERRIPSFVVTKDRNLASATSVAVHMRLFAVI